MVLLFAAWGLAASAGVAVATEGGDVAPAVDARLAWQHTTGATPVLRVGYARWDIGNGDFVGVTSVLLGLQYRVPLDGPWHPWLGMHAGWAHVGGRIWHNDGSVEDAELRWGGGADFALSQHWLVGAGLEYAVAWGGGSELPWLDFSASLSTTW